MSIKYEFKEITDNLHKEEEKRVGYYPRVVSKGTIHTNDMLEDLSGGSAMKKAELGKSLDVIQDYILRALKNGYDVCLSDFGTFSVSAESRIVTDKKEIRAESIKVKGMNFRTSSAFNKKLRTAEFERVKDSDQKNR